MSEKRRLFVVLPIYNEADCLESLLSELRAVCSDISAELVIVAVNDGSTDATDALLANDDLDDRLVVLTHNRNRGLGETVRDGFEYAADNASGDDIIVRLDADNTHDPKYIASMVGAIDDGADVAIASRFVGDGGQTGVPRDRAFISHMANLLFRLFFPMQGIREFTCGYRAYRAAKIKEVLDVFGNDFIQMKGFGFCCTLEKLLKLHTLNAQFREVPFTLHYERKQGKSKMLFNVTTMGYGVMVILYHWPWGGWKRHLNQRNG